MELLFLYIDDFRRIKKQSFNFSSDLNFSLTETGKAGSRRKFSLDITCNTDHVDLFESKIMNVTGIVGKNGAGKSSLIHAIKLLAGGLETLLSPLIFCIGDENTRTIYTCFYNGGLEEKYPKFQVEVITAPGVAKKYPESIVQGYYKTNVGTLNERLANLPVDFRSISLCFFSNAFDSHRENYYKNIYNLSTNFRVERFLQEYIPSQSKISRKKEKPNLDDAFVSHIGAYHSQELKCMVKFLSYAKTRSTHKVPDLPEKMVFTFDRDDFTFLVSDNASQFGNLVPALEKIDKRAHSILKASEDRTENFHHMIVLCSFYYLLRWNRLPREQSMNIFSTIQLLADDGTALFESLRDVLFGKISIYPDERTRSSTVKKLRYMLGNSFRKRLESLVFTEFDKSMDNVFTYEIEINNSVWPVLSIIHELAVTDDRTFVSYQWSGGLSTGQEAFISHFARLFDIKNKVKKTSIWLLIDEGDLHFHPEMQKEYFAQLLGYCRFIFPKNKIQIILATHSPFIVSDLPKQNLIFLKRDALGDCAVDDENLKAETFGANIHDLFKETLFISGSLMGDFARDKINEAIEWCADEQSPKVLGAYVKKLLGIIGEPIIKMKLTEMVAKKMGENQELARLEEQQRYIVKRMQEIRSGNDKD